MNFVFNMVFGIHGNIQWYCSIISEPVLYSCQMQNRPAPVQIILTKANTTRCRLRLILRSQFFHNLLHFLSS